MTPPEPTCPDLTPPKEIREQTLTICACVVCGAVHLHTTAFLKAHGVYCIRCLILDTLKHAFP